MRRVCNVVETRVMITELAIWDIGTIGASGIEPNAQVIV